MTSQAIVAGVAAGDETAAEELYRIFADMRNAARAMRGASNDAEDCIHDAYITVLNALRQGRLREPGCLRGYAWRALHNAVLTRRRCLAEHAIKVPLDALYFLRDGRPTPEQALLDRECDEQWERRIRALAPKKRTILRLSLAGYRDKEIMALTRLTLATVKMCRFRTIRRLRSA